MLTSVANYLFGSSEPEVEVDPPVELQTTPADVDKDWLLVDLPADKPVQEECHNRVHDRLQTHQHCDSDSDSACSTPGSISPLGVNKYFSHTKIGFHESCWILTPPPCFTADGASTSQVEMSPMENLLIEHPSMSVYKSQYSQGSSGEDSNMSESSNEDFSNVIAKRGLRPRNSRQVQQPPRRPQAVAIRAGIAAQTESVRRSQRVKICKDTHRTTRRHTDKMNKVLSNGNKPYSQKTRIQSPRSRMVQSYQMRH